MLKMCGSGEKWDAYMRPSISLSTQFFSPQ